MSLLGTSWDDPKTLAILNLAGGLMANRNAGQGLMQGLQGYQQTLANAEDRANNKMMRDYQIEAMKDAKTKREVEIEQIRARQGLIKGLGLLGNQEVDESMQVGPTQVAGQQPYPIQQGQNARDVLTDPVKLAQLKLAGVDLTDVAKLAQPNWQNINGNLVNTNAQGFKGGFQPGMHITPNGQAVLSVPGANGLPVVGAAPGSLETVGAFQTQEQNIKNMGTLLPREYVSATTGAPIGGTIGEYLRGQQGPQGQQISPEARAAILADAQKNGITNPTISPNWNYGQQQSGQRPPLQSAADAAAAEVKAKADAEKSSATETKAGQFADFKGQLQRARDLLNAGPTQSGVGALADTAAGFLGYSLPGADIAASLDAVGAWLVQNIPKAPGAQTDFELREYQKAAGAVGDRTIPIKERQAKLKEAENMIAVWEKRTKGGEVVKDSPNPSAMPELPKANSSNKGRVILDQQTGQRLRSNGMQWVPE